MTKSRLTSIQCITNNIFMIDFYMELVVRMPLSIPYKLSNKIIFLKYFIH